MASNHRTKERILSSSRAVIVSGADVQILTLKGALKLIRDLQLSTLEVIGVNGATTRSDRQGTLIVYLKGPQVTEYNLDLGTAHAMKSCPVNLLSLSRLVGIRAVLNFEKNECWMQPSSRFHSHGGEHGRIPLNQIAGLYEISLHKMALEADVVKMAMGAEDINSDAANF